MAKILILFAHPALEKSRVHRQWLAAVEEMPGITLHDLYEEYPDFNIDVAKEQKLLLAHDIFVFQHPFYWYSSPSIIKEWLDLVLQHRWAYGFNGTALKGKKWMHALSCGGGRESYTLTGLNKHTIVQLLAPFQQTAMLCNMQFLPPFVLHSTHRLTPAEISQSAEDYKLVLQALVADKWIFENMQQGTYMNELLERSAVAGTVIQ